MPDDVELHALVRAALLRESPLARHRELPARRSVSRHLALIAAGGAGPAFNYALVLGPMQAEPLLARAAQFFDGPFAIVLEVGTCGELEAQLLLRRWSLDEEEPALVLPRLSVAAPPPPPELSVRLVVDETGLRDFRSVSGSGPSVVPSLAAAIDPDVALFCGYCDGVAVASSRLVCLGDIAEIAGVVTIPERRDRGFGTALTWAAVQEGARRGCRAAALTATPIGYPVYLRMGFQPVATYRTYLPPMAG